MAHPRRAIVFDLDGTLVDTAPDMCGALNRVLADSGRSPVTVEAVWRFVGDGARGLLKCGFAATGEALADDRLEAKVAEFLAHYSEHLADASRPYDGVIETLESLRAQGARLAVCTNKPAALSHRLLEAIGLADFFAALLGGDSLPVRKPDPRHLLATIAQADAVPDEAAMVGDSLRDMQAAQGAGVPAIAVAYGYGASTATATAADAVIDAFPELPRALSGLP